jgi:hypothetical protein
MKREKQFKSYGAMVLFICILASFGCSHHYTPKQYPIKTDMVQELNLNQAVSVVNNQHSENMVLMGAQGFHKWLGNMHLWTEVAAELLRSELINRGSTVTSDAPKELKLAITRVNLFWGAWAIRCILSLRVETGDGYIQEFEGNNASPATLYRACDGAVTKAVAALLNDDQIRQYLQN